jgi:hypothetical protein
MSTTSTRRRRLVGCAVATAAGAAAITGGSAAAASVRGPSSLQAPPVAAALQREITASINGAPALAGLTSEGLPIVLRIAPNGRRLRVAVTVLEMRCTSGNSFLLPDGVINLGIKPNGRVRETAALPPSSVSSGVSVTGGSRSFSATVNRRRWTASGSWRLQVNFATSSGQRDSCDSGIVGFDAIL